MRRRATPDWELHKDIPVVHDPVDDAEVVRLGTLPHKTAQHRKTWIKNLYLVSCFHVSSNFAPALATNHRRTVSPQQFVS
jgi:desulfoferrodoxin (superoxide reductase-like protein)